MSAILERALEAATREAAELQAKLERAERCSACAPGDDSGLCFKHAEELAEEAVELRAVLLGKLSGVSEYRERARGGALAEEATAADD